jgi:hypothetical protein
VGSALPLPFGTAVPKPARAENSCRSKHGTDGHEDHLICCAANDMVIDEHDIELRTQVADQQQRAERRDKERWNSHGDFA